MAAQTKLTIILPYGMSARQTILHVRACMRHMNAEPEILVIGDRAIDPVERSKLTRQFNSYAHVDTLIYPDEVSLSTLRNRAAKKAKSQFLLFLRPDTSFHKDSHSILNLMLQRSNEPEAGAIGCLLIDAKSRIRHGGVFQLPGHQPAWLYYGQPLKKAVRYMGTRSFPYDIRKSRPVLAATGALMVSRRRFHEVGGFSNEQGASLDTAELDLCVRLNQRGWQTWYQAGGSLMIAPKNKRLPLQDGYVPSDSTPPQDKEVDAFLPLLGTTNLPKKKRRANLLAIFSTKNTTKPGAQP